MRLLDAQVALCREVVPGVHLLRLVAPEIARDAAPGQFVHVRCGHGSAPLLRRPISLHGIGRASWHEASVQAEREGGLSSPLEQARGAPELGPGEIDLLFAEVGKGTSLLAGLRPGNMASVLGPLGKGFRLDPRTRNVLLVAGGMGLAPLAALAAEGVRKDFTVTMLYGCRSAAAALPPWLLPPEVEYVVCSEDGGIGRKGLVTHFVGEFLEWADEIFACGPRPMLAALARHPGVRGAPVQVSIEERMACGVGACLGCAVRTKRGVRRVCRDGPVFELGEIEWE